MTQNNAYAKPMAKDGIQQNKWQNMFCPTRTFAHQEKRIVFVAFCHTWSLNNKLNGEMQYKLIFEKSISEHFSITYVRHVHHVIFHDPWSCRPQVMVHSLSWFRGKSKLDPLEFRESKMWKASFPTNPLMFLHPRFPENTKALADLGVEAKMPSLEVS